jgi:hypothetical protein
MRQHKLYKLTVSGRGVFPMDMLRHDEAWPADTYSAFELQDTQRTSGGRTVVLYSHREPTVARWNSFGWYCDAELVWSVPVKELA